MSTVKTKVTSEKVLTFLQNNFDKHISSVDFIKGGEMSQAFSFISNSSGYVIRVNSKNYSFEKDKYAYEHFRSNVILIPKIMRLGQFNEKLYFAISEQANGKNLDNFNEDTHRKLLPQLILVLDAIHKTKIDGQGRYGSWDKNGNATFRSWKDYILNKNDDVWKNWETLFKETFLEKDVVKKLNHKIKDLVSYLPEERYLVHGDYGFNNIVSDGEKITGVLDWGESVYGDFLYDVSWLEFYSSNIRYGQIFKGHYQKIGIQIPHYEERLLCYQLHLGLGGIGFFALSGQIEPYEWAKNKLLILCGLK